VLRPAAARDAAFVRAGTQAAEVYQRVRSKRDPTTVTFIPTPYPIEDQRWNFSLPASEQSGIFVGTREWDVSSRNHFAALLLARQLCEDTGEPVSVANLDGYKGRQFLAELRFPEGKLRLIEKWLPYPDYLREVARHKIILELDRSHVPGQVAGDAVEAIRAAVGPPGQVATLILPADVSWEDGAEPAVRAESSAPSPASVEPVEEAAKAIRSGKRTAIRTIRPRPPTGSPDA